jgi:GntR family transcriptional regulator/MocR family aminotransferase
MKRPWELQIRVRPDSGKAVYLQIADAVIEGIRSGSLEPGSALPGSRQLAALLAVNRNTIVEALEVLSAEGWIVSRERSGSFVSGQLPQLRNAPAPRQQKAVPAGQKVKPRIVFDDGFPDTAIAPIRELSRAYRQILERSGRWHVLGYAEGTADAAFQQAMVQMLNFRRGMRLTVEELHVTRGSQMAMYLTAQCLLSRGDTVAVENPGYRPAWDAFRLAGAEIFPVGVDEQGLITGELAARLKRGKRIRAVYTTPHHQFPTTVTMSLQRRLELIELSNKYGFTIIEDDYDNEFHFGQRPLLPLCSLGAVENFVYIGSMSKVLAPALRIGYLASSKVFIAKVAARRRLIDVQGDTIMEQALLQLIQDGGIKRHLKRATAHYREKRDVMQQLVQTYLGKLVTCARPEGGLAFWIKPLKPFDPVKLAVMLQRKGVRIVAPEQFSYDQVASGIRLGYASLSNELLEEGVRALADCLR